LSVEVKNASLGERFNVDKEYCCSAKWRIQTQEIIVCEALAFTSIEPYYKYEYLESWNDAG